MIDVIFEDENIVVCVKGVGIISQSDGREDMCSLLEKQTGSKIYPVHRLDTAVGGTMVFAKNSQSAALLSRQIASGELKKRYFAVISSKPEKESDTLTDLLFKDSSKNKTFVVKRERKGVKKASLEYKSLGESDGMTLTEVLLHTGRTHQIRVQFASRKHPLVGDGKYGSRESKCNVALWSYSVSFIYKGKSVSFSSFPDVNCFPWNKFSSVFDKD